MPLHQGPVQDGNSTMPRNPERRSPYALHWCLSEALQPERAAARRGFVESSELSSVTNIDTPPPTAGCPFGSWTAPVACCTATVLTRLARNGTRHLSSLSFPAHRAE